MRERNPHNEIPANAKVFPTLSETTEDIVGLIQSPSGANFVGSIIGTGPDEIWLQPGMPSNAAQSAVNALGGGGLIHVSPGVYSGYTIAINKSVTIEGTRDAIFTQAVGNNKPIFNVGGSSVKFTLKGISMVHGAVFREEANVCGINVSGDTDTIRLIDIFTSDFNNSLLVTAGTLNELIIRDSKFVYTYGRAGISNVVVDLGAPYPQPCASIAGNPILRIVAEDNEFNGLTDPTFAGISGDTPQGNNQQVAADNFIQTGEHKFASIKNNDILNHGIEGVFLARPSTAGDYTYSIEGNHTQARIPGDAGTYAPAFSLHNSRAVIFGNHVYGSTVGVNIGFSAYSELENVVSVTGNNFERVLRAIDATNVSSQSKFNGNDIWNSSDPCKTMAGDLCLPTEMYGIVTDRGNVSRNGITADEPLWDQTLTLVSRADNVFTVSSTSGVSAGGMLESYAGGYGVAYFPVTSVNSGASTITVDSAYATFFSAVTTGTLYYVARTGTPSQTGGIVVREGGAVFADGNTITGHQRDLSQQISGTITVTSHVSRNNKVTQPDNATFIHSGEISFSPDDIVRLSQDNVYRQNKFISQTFINDAAGSNLKKILWTWDFGSWQALLLNDDDSLRTTAIVIDDAGGRARVGTDILAGNDIVIGGVNRTAVLTVPDALKTVLASAHLDGATHSIIQVDDNNLSFSHAGFVNWADGVDTIFRTSLGTAKISEVDISGVTVSNVSTVDAPTPGLWKQYFGTLGGTGRTLVISGSPVAGLPLTFNWHVTASTVVTYTSSFRDDESVATTSLTLTPGFKFMTFIYSNGAYHLYDNEGSSVVGTFATLPVSPSEGDVYDISDCNTATWGAPAGGIGSTHASLRYNGTNWTVTGV